MKPRQVSIWQYEAPPQGSERGPGGVRGCFSRPMRPRGTGPPGVRDVARGGPFAGEDVAKDVLGNEAVLSGSRAQRQGHAMKGPTETQSLLAQGKPEPAVGLPL